MFVSDWKEFNGHCEATFSVSAEFSPIFFLRAVKNGDGTYHPTISDYPSRQLLQESNESLRLETAKYRAMCLATSFLNHSYQTSIRNKLINQR